ncbi:hypothetical protein DOM22_03785 [Bdellovibrio sp. ZAP7]|uniref:hypothetical protein n=1 Tax=Bdellovibrio sp. ZAP7 TaxID=2231053 RepID=UPI0011593765|nr:hypothetical protein [Bdellovibrio sp. ZAP7]QDK44339.1 hypothetical protein DOM22_03785 [Bdellovibrio sp. ZAP7]
MKSFKVFIATAVVTLSASVGLATMSQRPDQVNVCVQSLVNFRLNQVDQSQAYISCNSGTREDGAAFATCMANMNYVGLPMGIAQAQSPKSITATEVCASRRSAQQETDFLNCVYDAKKSMSAEESARRCALVVPGIYKPQSQFTNGDIFVPMSEEAARQQAIQELTARENGTYTSGRQEYRRQAPAPVHQYQPSAQTEDTSSSMSDLPEVE